MALSSFGDHSHPAGTCRENTTHQAVANGILHNEISRTWHALHSALETAETRRRSGRHYPTSTAYPTLVAQRERTDPTQAYAQTDTYSNRKYVAELILAYAIGPHGAHKATHRVTHAISRVKYDALVLRALQLHRTVMPQQTRARTP